MRYHARRLRYWIGARLLFPHIRRLLAHAVDIDQSSGMLPLEKRNTRLVATGLRYAMNRDMRRTTAKNPKPLKEVKAVDW